MDSPDMSSPLPTRSASFPKFRGLALLATLWGSGCANQANLVRSQTPNRADIRLAASSTSQSPPGYMGPLERSLKGAKWKREKSEALTQNDPSQIEGLTEYQAAEALYEEGRFKEAEKAFKRLAKQRRKTHESFHSRIDRWWGVKPAATFDTYDNFGDPIEEDSLFMKAECQYDQHRYAAAQDSYDELINRYPSTRHLDTVSRRYFQIARIWLGFPEKAQATGDVQVVSDEKDPDEEEKAEDFANVDSFYIPIVPNFFDNTRPVFDTRGRALQALRSVWLHDATGPLADDALMVSASFHLRTQDFEESSRLYKLLREQYPDSPHFQDAFLLGSHVTLASYQGSNYDGQNLNEAIQLKEAALRIFPDLSEEERNRLGGELNKMYEAEVARIWDKVEYYQAKNSPESVAIYCNILINKFPDSEYAERSRKILQEQGQAVVQPQWSWPRVGSKKPDPNEQQDTEAPPEAEEEEAPKAPLRLPKFNWPQRAVPAPDEEPDSTEPEESDSEEFTPNSSPIPRYQEASAEGRSAGRASLD